MHYNGVNQYDFQFHSLLRRVNSNISQGHSRVLGHMVGVSKIKIMPKHVVYMFMGMSRIIYKIIKTF